MTIKATIFLLLICQTTKAINLIQTIMNSEVLPTHNYHIVAPELFRNSSFAFATIRRSDKVGIDVSITITEKYKHSECSLILKPDDDGDNIVVTKLHRLNDQKVLIMGYESSKDEKIKGLLLKLDVKNCENLYLHSSFDLQSENHVVITRDKFEIFSNTITVYPSCTDGKIRMTFKSGKRELHCFDVDVQWSKSMFIGAFSFSDDVLMIRDFDSRGTYKILVYNTAVQRQQVWLTIPDVNLRTHVVSSDLAICWLYNKSLKCALIDKSGDLRLNKTIDYQMPVRIVSVVDGDDEILVLAEMDDRQSVIVTKISERGISQRTLMLNCSTVDDKRLALDARRIIDKGIVAVEYICEDYNRLVLHSIHIDD